ncbi:MAG: hypothetical protein AAFZ01_01600 [Pseudomonadota bacterium]
MAANVHGHIFERREDTSDTPDLRRGFEVAQVFPGSPAFHAALQPGMVLLVPDAPLTVYHAAELGELGAVERGVFRFWNPVGQTVVSVEAQGFPHGMELVPTLERMHEQVDRFTDVATYAINRALRGTDEDLRRIAQTAHRSRESLNLYDIAARGIIRALVWVFARDRMKVLYSAERIIEAALAAEEGNIRLAKKLLPDDDHDVVAAHGSEAAVLYFYTAALIEGAESNDRGALETRLAQVRRMARGPAPRIDGKLAQLGVAPSVMASHDETDDPWPLRDDVTCYAHDPVTGPLTASSQPVSLAATLRGRSDHQMLLVVMLGGYRANGFYDPMMGSLGKFYPSFADWFPNIWVTTSYDKEVFDNNFEPWMDGEHYAISRGVPLQILFDVNGEIDAAFRPTGSPQVAILDRAGMVFSSGANNIEEAVWAAITRVAAAEARASKRTAH